MKASMKASGMSEKAATKRAAMTWNKTHKGTGKTVGKGRK